MPPIANLDARWDAASLAHPTICTLHDVGVDGDSAYFVMELLAGDTLAERLIKGRMSLEMALSVAVEIGEALTVAHRAGIVHRDLKPGNVMVTKTESPAGASVTICFVVVRGGLELSSRARVRGIV